jgi:hypothetical protein
VSVRGRKKLKKEGRKKVFLGWQKKYSLASFGLSVAMSGLQECIF